MILPLHDTDGAMILVSAAYLVAAHPEKQGSTVYLGGYDASCSIRVSETVEEVYGMYLCLSEDWEEYEEEDDGELSDSPGPDEALA